MSVRVLSRVWEFYPDGGSRLLGMLALADWSDDEGHCWPAMNSIAHKMRLTVKHARRVIHELIADGYVEVTGFAQGGPTSCRYQIKMAKLAPPFGGSPPIQGIPPAEGSTPSRTGEPTPPAQGSRTVIEPSIIIKGFELPNWVPVNEWNAFVEHRKKLKKPLTSHAMNLAINQLKKIVDAGHKPDEVINEAILKGWQSFYAPKGNANSGGDLMAGVL